MALRGSGVLAIWNGVADGAADEFVAWHVREHIPERVALPGFRRGRRYVAVDGEPQFFNFYEADTADVFTSDGYRARLDDPTPWTRAVVRTFTGTIRTVCRVARSEGAGAGGFVEAIRLSVADADRFASAFGDWLSIARDAAGITGAHLLQGLADASAAGSAEKALRSAPDAVADWVILVEAVDAEPLAALRAGSLSGAALSSMGAAGSPDRGIYRLQFDLDHDGAVASRSAPNRTDRT